MAVVMAGLLVFAANGAAQGAGARAPVCPGAGNVPSGAALVEFSSAVAGNRFLATNGQEFVLAGIWTPSEKDGYAATRLLASILTGRHLAACTW